MKLVSAKCPNCGASIEVDKNSDYTKCEYCNNKIFVDEAINKFKVEINGEISVKNLPKLENYIKLAERYYNDGEYDEAYKQYDKASELDPDNPTIILKKGLSKALNTNYLNFNVKYVINAMKNATKIIKENNNNFDVDILIKESYSVILKLQLFITQFYCSNEMNLKEISDYIDKLYMCLEALKYLENSVQSDDDLKIQIINSILILIDDITKGKKYYAYVNNRKTKKVYRINRASRKLLIEESKKYKFKIFKMANKDNPNVVTEKKQKIEKTNKIKFKLNTTISNILCYFVAFNFFILFLGSAISNMQITAVMSVLSTLLFIPKIKTLIQTKFKATDKAIIILRIIFSICTIACLSTELNAPYKNTWVSGDTSIIINSNIIIKENNSIKLESTYEVKENSTDSYDIIVENDGNKYIYRYEEVSYHKVRFCLLEEDECSVFYQPQNPEDGYEYLTK